MRWSITGTQVQTKNSKHPLAPVASFCSFINIIRLVPAKFPLGAATDVEIQAKEILFVKACLNKYMTDYTGQEIEKIADDTDRDFFMTPYEAEDYGIIDEVITTKTSHIPVPNMPSIY